MAHPLCLKVRSWWGNDVPIHLYQMNVIFCPDKRGQRLKAQLSHWNVPSWLSRNRFQLAAPSGQGSHSLPSSHPYWSQAPNPIGPVSSGCPNEATSSHRLRLRKMTTARGCRDRDVGEVHRSSRSGPRLQEGPSEGSGALQDVVPSLFPGTSSSPTGPRQGDVQALQKKDWICLFSHFPAVDHHTTLI